jgi:hypothetical protein
MLSTWKDLSVLRPTLTHDNSCMIYTLFLPYRASEGALGIDNGSRLAGGQRIYTAPLNAQFALASGWAVMAADCAPCPCPCANVLSLRNSVLAYLFCLRGL